MQSNEVAMNQHEVVTGTIALRRDWPVKPAAEALNGKTLRLRVLWPMEDGDRYSGEWALGPVEDSDAAFRSAGIGWIASGDVVLSA